MVILLRAPLLLKLIAILLWLVFMVVGILESQTTRSSNVSCIDSERWALLEFKSSLVFDTRRNLSDWSNEIMDCCKWEGIQCSKAGRVVTLDLHSSNDVWCKKAGDCIGGEISPSLLHLPYLNYLDLSSNDFTKVPEFVGSLKRLRYLNLSNNLFNGIVPHQLGNLSVLETLDLSDQELLQVDSLTWVSNLTSLKYLDLSGISFSSVPDWLQSISKLPYLANLYLQGCELTTFPAPTKINASMSLQVVDLAWSNSYGRIPDFLCKLRNLKQLHLNNNYFEGEIPETFSNLSNLLTLDVSWNRMNKSSGFLQSGSNSLFHLRADYNNLQGDLPSLSKFPCLQVLNLAHNKFGGSLAQLHWHSPHLQSGSTSLRELRVENNFLQGNLPNLSKFPSLEVLSLAQNKLGGSLAQLRHNSNLSMLDVSSNQFSGIITGTHFQNLSKLQVLSLSMNSLTLNFSTLFRLPFQLRSLKLRDCKLGKSIPLWLRMQKNLVSLDISNNGISGVVPTWFWNISSNLQSLNVSHNSLSGTIPPNSLSSCYFIVLSFNSFHGPVPALSREVQHLDLSSNTFSGGINFLCGLKAGKLNYLDLSDNLLSGNLPNCWERVRKLYHVNLSNNNFAGFVPNSMGKLDSLMSLSLRNNSFSGAVPKSMQNCTILIFLDFGMNQFSGSVPEWIGTSLKGLGFLRLNLNKFVGKIPSTLCSLNLMQILDLSFNNISGDIPSCLNNFKAFSNRLERLVTPDESGDLIISRIDDFSTSVFWKGLQIEFKNVDNIELLILIDLSSNRLSGLFPRELTNQYELVSLNLSHNDLNGPIPDKIGQMRMLESLDLSGNQLSGEIPWSMSNLTTLSYLDLSFNNLTGSIPISTQLQSFEATMFRGNLGLCGAPLPNSCHQGGSNVDYDSPNTEGGDGNENLWMYISIGLGFMLGFWGVCGPLLVKDSWRQKYFQVLNLCKERLLVALLIGLANLRRRFET